ncbi:hypothetical protein SODALDRAFT_283063 [Sodiomyces alkalinus F11]|uniref:RRM domain-containing protein n=1 Tax=Sodiomyces alkalinus (strain CBS 110278 / VKM F-3762 / F11) TaxID=1314773 RepID=A0A3N2PML8_SODAK|nr:hypothetical protein SODALDRAFT_283063 [Sodiomyces alkalinus F11]ROT35781.1 hypothetical protein SODALDRAFT_283063 [Sodiomyces alkalinus F11]
MPAASSTPPIQATADLSPLAPSPLHSVATAVLPALQDTADFLDAMTEMPAEHELQSTGPGAGAPSQDPPAEYDPSVGLVVMGSTADDGGGAGADNESNIDIDSLDDAYEEKKEPGQAVEVQPEEPDAGEDEYLKSFDSPAQDIQDDSSTKDDVSHARESIPRQLSPEASQSAQAVPKPVIESTPAQPSVTTQSPGDGHPVANPQVAGQSGVEFNQTQRGDQVPPVTNGQSSSGDAHADDISRLVAEMTGQTTSPNSHSEPGPSSQNQESSTHVPQMPATSASSLPPRPPMPQEAAFSSAHAFAPRPAPVSSHSEESRAFQLPTVASIPASTSPTSSVHPPSVASLTPSQPSTYVAAGAPGTYTKAEDLPPPPLAPINSSTGPSYSDLTGVSASRPDDDDAANRERLWSLFNEDERRYMSEGRWDRFPEGSRIFIGNLSSERVSKRDVFDIFYRFGRLAQISLKSAYGFVQYHNAEDAQAVMQNLQGIEIKGRKIHLEISRTQKKKGDDGRRDAGQRSGDRSDASQPRRQRDDHRHQGRGASPRRNRGDKYGRERDYYEPSHNQHRGRSRSPPAYGRQQDAYRQRSPSPAHGFDDRLEIPRRYGDQVPDVQFLLLQEVGRDFVDWVQRAFLDRGLKVDVMFLNPGFPRAAVLQRQVAEGVHGIVELDIRAHSYGKIPLQVFDRSSGLSARFDEYQDLDPPIAAELVLRAKTQARQAQTYNNSHYPPQPAYAAGGYPYQQPPQPQYGQHPPPQASPHVASFPTVQRSQGPQAPPVIPPSQNPVDLVGLLGQYDNAGLQQLLGSTMQHQQQNGVASQPARGIGAAPQAGSQLDIQALLASLNGSSAAMAQPAHYGGQAYPSPASRPPVSSGHPGHHLHEMNGGSSPDSASQVHTIMAQLAKFRQP